MNDWNLVAKFVGVQNDKLKVCVFSASNLKQVREADNRSFPQKRLVVQKTSCGISHLSVHNIGAPKVPTLCTALIGGCW